MQLLYLWDGRQSCVDRERVSIVGPIIFYFLLFFNLPPIVIVAKMRKVVRVLSHVGRLSVAKVLYF